MNRKLLVLSLLGIATFSCVSNKKYEALQTELAKYKVDDTFQGQTIATKTYEKSTINLDMSQEMIKKNNTIDSLQREIAILKKKLRNQ